MTALTAPSSLLKHHVQYMKTIGKSFHRAQVTKLENEGPVYGLTNNFPFFMDLSVLSLIGFEMRHDLFFANVTMCNFGGNRTPH